MGHPMTGLKLTLGGILAALSVLVLAPPASAGERMIRVDGQGPGPAAFDGVDVHQFGPRRPDRVLVLMAGTAGGAGNFTLFARDLVERIDGLAIWSIDRRSQILEDTSRFEAALAGEISLQQMFDYYLGWLTNGGTPADHFDFLDTSTVPFARRWGMKNALKDARKVVKRARKAVGKPRGKGEVFLGGHSLGASLAAAYAAWDFDGRPGYKSIDGVVMIDGGLLGTFATLSRAEAVEQVAGLKEQPFLDLLGVGIPDAAGLFAESGAIMARLDPTGDGRILREFPLLPAEFKPPVDATNRGNFGYAFDRDTSPAGLALLHVNAGSLAPAGDPRDWADGGVTPVENIIATFGTEPANGVEWYFPRRLTIDTDGANEMKRNAVARFLGLRLMHTRQIDVPIYAFQTDLTDGRVLAGAEKLVKRARTRRRDAVLVNGDPLYSHLDPLMASSGKNLFTRTVAGFIRSYSGR